MNSKIVSQLDVRTHARNGSRLRKAINRVTKADLIDFKTMFQPLEERLSKQTTYLDNSLAYSVTYLILTSQSLNQQLSQ